MPTPVVPLDLRLRHLRPVVLAVHLVVAVPVPQCPLLQSLLFFLSVPLDERGVVPCDLEAALVRLIAAGLDLEIPRGLTVLYLFPEEVGLVYPPCCYGGLAIVARRARRAFVLAGPHRSTYSSCAGSWALRGC